MQLYGGRKGEAEKETLRHRLVEKWSFDDFCATAAPRIRKDATTADKESKIRKMRDPFRSCER